MKSVIRCVLASSVLFGFGIVACTSSEKKEEPTPAVQPPPAPVATPVPLPPEPTVAATPVPEALYLETVYFDFDSDVLRVDAKDVLRKVASSLKSNSGAKVQIEGHCDERGSNEYNLVLGEKRATRVKEFLTGEGVGNDSLSTISYGEEKPAATGTGEGVWSKNRRVEFKKLN